MSKLKFLESLLLVAVLGCASCNYQHKNPTQSNNHPKTGQYEYRRTYITIETRTEIKGTVRETLYYEGRALTSQTYEVSAPKRKEKQPLPAGLHEI